MENQELFGYQSPRKEDWKGRKDAVHPTRLHEVIQLFDVNKLSSAIILDSVGFVGFSCDEGIRRNLGHTGAKEGPEAIRLALSNLPIPNSERHYGDFGTVYCSDDRLEDAQGELASVIEKMLSHEVFPIVLGGGHEMAWGHFQGISAAYPDKKITIINFDAHFDLRPLKPESKGTSGTSFTQIANFCKNHGKCFDYVCLGIQAMGNTKDLFTTSDNLDVKYLLADDFHLNGPESASEFLEKIIANSEFIYLTLCLDVFAAPFAPGVSAPQPLGLFPWHVIPLLHKLAESGKVISFDIAELCPEKDTNKRTAHLAASLLYHFMNHQALNM